MVELGTYLLFCKSPFIKNITDSQDVILKYTKMDTVCSPYFLSHAHTSLFDGHWESQSKWKILPAYTTAKTAAAMEEPK